MPILPRYLLRQFFPVFGACIALFLGVLMMNQFLRLFSLAMMKGIPAWWILSCFVRLLPSLASLAVPMAFLVATMVTLGQLAETGEVMALRASGFSFSEITRPFLWLALALSAAMLLINHKMGPEGFHSFKKRTSEAAQKVARVELRPRSFAPLGPWRLYARDSDPLSGRLEGVYLVKPGQSQGIRINAESGTLTTEPERGISLELVDGQLQLPSDDPERFTTGRFARYRVFVPLSAAAAPRELDMQEMNTARLRERASLAQTPRERRLEYRVESTLRTVGALSPFVFFWIGAPLGLGLKRRARGADFATSLLVMFAFYGLMVVGVSVGRRHEALASVAPWLGSAVGLITGAWLSRRAAAQ
ncbi:MAG: LptF/LptG family permease [Elusimicrobia bacterium]|nr:LptF/LptG family permease [Elusimicrobiota bacterium]